jgi:aminomethyltransferase
MADDRLKTPLHAWHAAHHGRLVEFAGWEMPIQYTSIVDEHVATRTAAGLFDISHMGRFEFQGPDALRLLDRLLTRRVAQLKPGSIRYSLVTHERGGVLDDVLVYHVPRLDGSDHVMMVVNASNRKKMLGWIDKHQQPQERASVQDVTRETAMLAVQGPRALELIEPRVDIELRGMKYYTGSAARWGEIEVLISRTGYTGEDGFELIVPAGAAPTIWRQLIEAGTACSLRPVGLAARDTLRLEAGMPLYGHELTEEIHPYQAGLAFAVQLDNHAFVGRDALVDASADTTSPRRIGLRLSDRRVAREQCRVFAGDREVGVVTSGTFSPTLQCPIAMAYVAPDAADVGRSLSVDIRGRAAPAEVVELPFYSRTS